MNRVILVGRLVKDPELKRTNNDIAVVQFTLAVNRSYVRNGEKQADFISCVVWRQQAENLAKYMRKGNQIGVEGQLQVRTFDDNNGARRYITEVICDSIHFLESKNARDNSGYRDVNSYDIPDYKGSQSSLEFSDLSPQDRDNKQDKSIEDEDPFASLKTTSGVSDDDLPF